MRLLQGLVLSSLLVVAGCGDSGPGEDNQNNNNDVLDADGDGWPASEDCDDSNPDVFPGSPEPPNDCTGGPGDRCNDGIDQDCDGMDTYCVVDADCDGSPAEQDCDDNNPDVYPGQAEDCTNAIDDNCNGQINEACVSCDLDGDGFQRMDLAVGCPDASYPPGQDVDCNDFDAGIFPGITDGCGGDEGGSVACTAMGLCDGVDNDCDGTVDEGCAALSCDADQDGYQNTSAGCTPPVGQEDCDDSDPQVYPGAPDLCGDGVAQNCNTDTPCDSDNDQDGYNASVDCDDDDPSVFPGAVELCNGVDDDCDGLIDEGNPGPGGVALVDVYCNDDNDGECGASPGPGRCICSAQLPGTVVDVTNRTACDGEDLGAARSPRCFFAPQPEVEQCDALDHDCDGVNDDPTGVNLLEVGQPCGSDVGECVAGTVVGCDLTQTTVGAFNEHFVCAGGFVGAAPELCNGLDDDCDGVVPTDELDWDNDGYIACTGCAGLTLAAGLAGCDDCAPMDMSRSPGAPELCNGVDDNCTDGVTDDGADECGGATGDCCGNLMLCVNLDTDFAHCGGCTDACDANTSNRCEGGNCLCGTGQPCTGNLQCVGAGAAATCQ